MARYAANARTTLELSAHACVCAPLAAGALTKGCHTHRAIGATILLYVLHLATQVVKRGPSFVHGLEVADSIMMKTRAAAIGLTTAATMPR